MTLVFNSQFVTQALDYELAASQNRRRIRESQKVDGDGRGQECVMQ